MPDVKDALPTTPTAVDGLVIGGPMVQRHGGMNNIKMGIHHEHMG